MDSEKFVAHFAQQFDDTDPSEIKQDTRFKDLDEWSSLTALSIIAMADEEYNLKLTGEDIRTADTVQDLFNKLAAKK